MADRDAIVRNAVTKRWRGRVEQAQAALFEVARTAGADLDGAKAPQEVPDVAALALDAVRDLRADYDEAGAAIEQAEAAIARSRASLAEFDARPWHDVPTPGSVLEAWRTSLAVSEEQTGGGND